MTTAEISEKQQAEQKSPGKKGSLSDEKKDDSDASVMSGSGPTKTKSSKNWLGKEVKRPRAEYQAEINELKLKLAEVQLDLEYKTIELKQFKDWVSMAPAAF